MSLSQNHPYRVSSVSVSPDSGDLVLTITTPDSGRPGYRTEERLLLSPDVAETLHNLLSENQTWE